MILEEIYVLLKGDVSGEELYYDIELEGSMSDIIDDENDPQLNIDEVEDIDSEDDNPLAQSIEKPNSNDI